MHGYQVKHFYLIHTNFAIHCKATYDLNKFPKVWSSLLTVKWAAFGTFVSLAIVILKKQSQKFVNHQQNKCETLFQITEALSQIAKIQKLEIFLKQLNQRHCEYNCDCFLWCYLCCKNKTCTTMKKKQTVIQQFVLFEWRQFFQRCFRGPIWVPRIENRVPRIRENYHQVPRIREIRSLQAHIRYLTFSLKTNLMKGQSIKPSTAVVFNLGVICLFYKGRERFK